MKTIIEVEIFDDSQEPITCSRGIEPGQSCPQLMTTRCGIEYVCRLFMETFGSKYDRQFLERYPTDDGKMGFLKPCNKCLKLRKKVQNG